MSRMMPLAFLCCCLSTSFLYSAAPEANPPETSMKIDAIKGGYRITLSRSASEQLRDGLTILGDGKAASDLVKQLAKGVQEPEMIKQLNFLAFVLRTQAPAIKKSLEDKMGPNGAIIKLVGTDQKKIAERPLLKELAEKFLPEDVKDTLKATIAVINTAPLFWTVEGRP